MLCVFHCCPALQLDCNKIALVAPFDDTPLKRDMYDNIWPDFDAVTRNALLVFLLDDRVIRQDAVPQAHIKLMKQRSLEAPLVPV